MCQANGELAVGDGDLCRFHEGMVEASESINIQGAKYGRTLHLDVKDALPR